MNVKKGLGGGNGEGGGAERSKMKDSGILSHFRFHNSGVYEFLQIHGLYCKNILKFGISKILKFIKHHKAYPG